MATVKYYDSGSGQYVPVSADGPPGPPGVRGPGGKDAVKDEVAVGTGTPAGSAKVWARDGRVQYLAAPGTWAEAPAFGGQRITGASDGTAATDGATKQQVDALTGRDSGWITASPLTSGWRNYGNPFPPLRYRRTQEGIVHVQGLIAGGTVAHWHPFFQLPLGFRPSASGGLGRLIFMQMCNANTQARVDVLSDGRMEVNWVWGSNDWVSVHLSFYTNPVMPGPVAPTNFRATNIGAATNSVDLAWNASNGALSYKIHYDTGGGIAYHGVTTGLTYTVAGMSNHTNHSFYIEAVDANGNVSTVPAGPVKVRSGAPGSIVAGGTGYVSGGIHSVNRWRQGQWGYGGSNQPYIGWYSNEGYRYHSFMELPDWFLRNHINQSYPQLTNLHQHVAATAAGIFFTRSAGVGSNNSAQVMQVSLGNGISYASGAEPPQQINVFDVSVYPSGNGQVGYSMPANWYQAIYQNHASYNGLLWRPYRNGGGRVPYAAFNAGGITFDLSISWGQITAGAPTYTSAW